MTTHGDDPDSSVLYERDAASVDRIGDLVLLVLATVDADQLPHDELVICVVSLVEDHGEAFDVTTDSAAIETLDALGMLASLDYVDGHPYSLEAETARLTDRGEQAAHALIAGLGPEGQAALTGVAADA
ncbi:hypothetical protein [Halorussus marinus]|uniref:hypothetical protein n=1 Tax=Halorussus marinus TaxID=2505976 RepID=UPI00109310DB|nr:hypothetical protein [Halorussus marinus]